MGQNLVSSVDRGAPVGATLGVTPASNAAG
jgi:hypothetical protein